MTQNLNNLVWIDLEMTGLDPDNDRIIEIATIVTDAELNILAEGPALAIYQTDEVLGKMDEWCTRQHGQSGLTERVRNSRISEREAELQTIEFLRNYVPELEKYFHYRNLDVSTLKELATRWAPQVMKSFSKNPTHLALDDIRDSIRELQHYRTHLIKLPETKGTTE